MFFSTLGETGPRIVLIQSLLRLKGINVRINGVWDEATSKSVAEYRTGLKISPMGPVDARVFFNLIQKTHLKVVDSIDGSAGEVRIEAEKDMRKNGIDPLINERHVGRGVSVAIDRIIARAQNHRIALLRIIGHGNRGAWISVALGNPFELKKEGREEEYQALKADWKSYIDFSHFERLRPILRRLRPLFAQYGSAEAHCCRIGNQKVLLQKMADTWGVPMSGAYSDQQVGEGYNTNQYGEHVPITFAFQGAVFTAYPDGGNLKTWASKVDSSIPDLPKMTRQIKETFQNSFGGR